MGNYTELIFGAKLKKNTPSNVVEVLKYMIGDTSEKPKDFPLPDGRCEWLLRGASYYFAINNPVSKIWFDEIDNCWRISSRSNIKNYDSEIETFLNWIKEFIESGSGERELYAIVIYEQDITPTCYYLYEN